MTNPEFPDDYYMTVEEFTEEFEGKKFIPVREGRDFFKCDFCSKGVPYAKEGEYGHYLADRVPHNNSQQSKMLNEKRTLATLATYCEECTYPMLFYPCRGYTEVRAIASISENLVYENVDVVDIAPEDDGIPWDPAEVSEKITGIPFEQHLSMVGDMLMGPENIVTWFFSISENIDIRELVDYDGTINPRYLGRARKEHQAFMEKYAGNPSSQEFTKHVREKWEA